MPSCNKVATEDLLPGGTVLKEGFLLLIESFFLSFLMLGFTCSCFGVISVFCSFSRNVTNTLRVTRKQGLLDIGEMFTASKYPVEISL